MYISQQITTLRKEGNLDAAERLASSGFEENMDNKFFQSAQQHTFCLLQVQKQQKRDD